MVARGWGIRHASAAAALVAAGVVVSACSSETPPPSGQLIMAVQSDMSLPKDVDEVRIDIFARGVPKFTNRFVAGPAGVRIPATLGILPAEDDPGAPIQIRVVAYRRKAPRVLRDVVTTIPRDRVATLRVPIQWINDGSARPITSPTTGRASTRLQQLPPDSESVCPEGTTMIDGECQDWTVDSSALPVYEASEVFGGGSDDGTGGSCFDTIACTQDGTEIVPDDTCTVAAPPGDPGHLNIALRLPPGGDGVCDETACYIPLDGTGSGSALAPGSDAGAGESATAAGALKLPAAICRKLATVPDASLLVSTRCASKTASQPTCGPWSVVPPGPSTSPPEAGADAAALVAVSVQPQNANVQVASDETARQQFQLVQGAATYPGRAGWRVDRADATVDAEGRFVAAPPANGRFVITALTPQGLPLASTRLQVTRSSSCKPRTCGELQATCGQVPDGCGGMLTCGGCTSPQRCGAIEPNRCGCQPTTCAAQPTGTCGALPDGCGGTIECGGCQAPLVCGAVQPGRCGCKPRDCTLVPRDTCGPLDDGCGGTITCNTCAPPQTCGAVTPGRCSCKALTCAAQPPGTCGPVSDGCGGTLDCGTCLPPQTCGAVTPGRCGCRPVTCAALPPDTCGQVSDGCGQSIDCGGCTAPATCGGVQPGKCGCKPKTCASANVKCGPLPDGCGTTLNCGTCTAPNACGGGGVPSQCGGATCVPQTCTSYPGGCGPQSDGCGGLTANCGTCSGADICGGATGSGRCAYTDAGTCSPRTCAQLGVECGATSDGCGGILQCGSCPVGKTCGGGGVPSRCGGPTCIPRSCSQAGAQCGPIPDGCGGLTHCGDCATGSACSSTNQCVVTPP